MLILRVFCHLHFLIILHEIYTSQWPFLTICDYLISQIEKTLFHNKFKIVKAY